MNDLESLHFLAFGMSGSFYLCRAGSAGASILTLGQGERNIAEEAMVAVVAPCEMSEWGG